MSFGIERHGLGSRWGFDVLYNGVAVRSFLMNHRNCSFSIRVEDQAGIGSKAVASTRDVTGSYQNSIRLPAGFTSPETLSVFRSKTVTGDDGEIVPTALAPPASGREGGRNRPLICYSDGGVKLERRDGRVAEGARLESVYTFTGIGGSNPSLSAIRIPWFPRADFRVRWSVF